MSRRVARRPRRWFRSARANRRADGRARLRQSHVGTARARVAGPHAAARRRVAEWAAHERARRRSLPRDRRARSRVESRPSGPERRSFRRAQLGDCRRRRAHLLRAATTSVGVDAAARSARGRGGRHPVVAATALVVHPVRRASRTTRTTGGSARSACRSRSPSDAPVLRANDAGASPAELIGTRPRPVAGATAACLVVDRRAYDAAVAGADDDIELAAYGADLDVAMFALCRRLTDAGRRDRRGAGRGRGRPSSGAVRAPRSSHPSRPRHRRGVPTSITTGPRCCARCHRCPRVGCASRSPSRPRRRRSRRAGATGTSPTRSRGRCGGAATWCACRRSTTPTISPAASCDVHCVVRGLAPVRRTPGQAHVLWIISHPEDVTTEECDDADLVLVASHRFADDAAPPHATHRSR